MPHIELVEEVDAAIIGYEQATGHRAARTRLMIDELGPIEALSRLAISAELHQGFQVLRDRGQLYRTFEAIIVRRPDEFRATVVEAAQWRLDNANNLL